MSGRTFSRTFNNLNASKLTLTKGSVTQITNITTPVTLNASAGYITTVSSTLAANGSATFTVNNTNARSDSCIVANVSNYSGTTGVPVITVDNPVNNAFSITVTNVSDSAALNGTIKISFIVV